MDRTTGPRGHYPVWLIVLIAALMFSAVLTGPALAGNGHGKGKGNGGRSESAAALVVSPNPAASGSYVTISGSGFQAGTMVQVGISGYIPFYAVTTDSTGSFSFAHPRAVMGPCECLAEVWGLNGNNFEMLARTSFTILAP